MDTRLHREPLALPFFALVLVLLFGSTQYANNLGFFFAFWLIALAVGGLFGLRARLARVEVRVQQVDSGFADTPLAVHLELRQAQGLWLTLDMDESSDTPARRIDTPLQSVSLPPRLRGAHRVGNVRLRLRDALGVVRAERVLPLSQRYWVYPVAQGNRPLPVPAAPDAAHGQDDFHGLRSYQAGDAPARIHWKSLAKSDPRHPELRVKQFASEQACPARPRLLDEHLLLDLPRETRLSQLAAWIVQCEHAGETYALRLANHAPTPPGVGEAHRLRCLRLLAEA